MATIIDNILYDSEKYRPWSEWGRCFMVWRRGSITGKLIWGFGWMRECDGIYEIPDQPGYFYVPGKEFAESKQEIFIHKLKGEE